MWGSPPQFQCWNHLLCSYDWAKYLVPITDLEERHISRVGRNLDMCLVCIWKLQKLVSKGWNYIKELCNFPMYSLTTMLESFF